MGKRIISAIILIVLLVPVIMHGGMVFDLIVYLVSLFALKEFLDIKEDKKTLPTFVRIMCYLIYVSWKLPPVFDVNLARWA